MRRRDFVGLIGGALASPSRSRAQQTQRVRRLGLLLTAPPRDQEYPGLVNAFLERLRELGWSEGRNLKVEVRWGGGGAELAYKNALELVALSPEVIVAPGSSSAGPALRATRDIPVVFTIVPDPVGAGFVESLARPGGNATGFVSFDYSIGGKWLELLKEVAPAVKRVGVLRDTEITAGIGQWSAIQAVAPMLGLEVTPINLHDAPDVERALADFGRAPKGGLVITSGAAPVRHRDVIVRLAADYKLPAIYYAKAFVTSGGLMSYGTDRIEQFRLAAEYVGRILDGARPADLPVQAPTKYEFVVNLNTVKALGVTIPASLLARADEVIE